MRLHITCNNEGSRLLTISIYIEFSPCDDLIDNHRCVVEVSK